MKKFIYFLSIFCLFFVFAFPMASKSAKASAESPKLVIIIDDFGGWDQSGVETMLSISAPLTCAVIPDVDNTTKNTETILNSGKEVIVHMPMQAHVSLPENWYGSYYISTSDSKESVDKKLDKAFASVKGAKGFNIHIGSGVCQNRQVVSHIYDYAKKHNLPFVDSRTHMKTICEEVAKEKGVRYFGRDEFLEPDHDRSYAGVTKHLFIAVNKAKETGFAIAIGHVGSHGGENTAKAIKDSIQKIKEMGVEIIPLSKA